MESQGDVIEKKDVMERTCSRRRTWLVRKVLRALGLAETMAVDVMVGVTTRGSKKEKRGSGRESGASDRRLEVAPVAEDGELVYISRLVDVSRLAGDVGGLVDNSGLAGDVELVDGLEFAFQDSIGDFNWRDAYHKDATFRMIYGKMEMAGEPLDGFVIDEDRMLLYDTINGQRICIPAALLREALHVAHDLLGHLGYKKIYLKLVT